MHVWAAAHPECDADEDGEESHLRELQSKHIEPQRHVSSMTTHFTGGRDDRGGTAHYDNQQSENGAHIPQCPVKPNATAGNEHGLHEEEENPGGHHCPVVMQKRPELRGAKVATKIVGACEADEGCCGEEGGNPKEEAAFAECRSALVQGHVSAPVRA